ncbi:formate dehydrogenase subunit gamma [Variovorax sp. NFACC27]|jgi:formate dehydrogenase subunit gamma|uniref:Formate dehydrogenase subunit gamma n=1 Tax=Variovorax gossypii TaxID=1679495 RepID=A0A3S0IDD4_9BURK|nr:MULTISPECIES: formate dehydrogenase subunit gamma [Variovorax]MDP9605920.1 formate dehydrogenase subunit gamma [Variovorax paradoxus]SEF29337.1 formate dehydrogenase gamma subunit [Variovorax sp. NFACC28]SEG92900.1 formate dehydrogenase gamma subunit [Variovorax sp. NFACC29]SFD67592.1 formate dehydrogenase gamma subunit [Variovorax sp. NFACC26]SFH11302.1 formate dehydrogenase gamma subunit [Variovorax sp. NFACC27]
MKPEQVQQARQGQHDTDELAAVQRILQLHADEPGALLPILHDVQDALGYIPADAVPVIAEAQNLSRAEVHGVVTYYHHFRSQPAGRHVIQICRAEACQSMGADALLAHAELRLGCSAHGTTKDGAFTLEPAFCLGLCASSPAMTLDEQPYARMTAKGFDALVAQTEGGRA